MLSIAAFQGMYFPSTHFQTARSPTLQDCAYQCLLHVLGLSAIIAVRPNQPHSMHHSSTPAVNGLSEYFFVTCIRDVTVCRHEVSFHARAMHFYTTLVFQRCCAVQSAVTCTQPYCACLAQPQIGTCYNSAQVFLQQVQIMPACIVAKGRNCLSSSR